MTNSFAMQALSADEVVRVAHAEAKAVAKAVAKEKAATRAVSKAAAKAEAKSKAEAKAKSRAEAKSSATAAKATAKAKAKAKGNIGDRAVAASSTGINMPIFRGCSKCRFSKSGCSRCRPHDEKGPDSESSIDLD